jgi:hypothetical protein
MILIWLAWGVFVIWAARHISNQWRLYIARDPYALDPPEFSTFLFIEAILVSNGVLHILLDRKPLYLHDVRGFMNSGFTEAQLFFMVAWTVLILTSVRWYWKYTARDPALRWHAGCWLLILGLVATSLFCWLVLGIPISRDAPYL